MSRRPAARRRDEDPTPPGPPGLVRLDRWLVAARCFKTRPLAQEACAGGHVKVNEHLGESGRPVKRGDRVELWRAGERRVLQVRELAERRGPAEQARLLYEDLTPPPPPAVGPVAGRDRGEGRPTKRDMREIRRFKTWDEEQEG